MFKISVIIPVKNGALTIEKCLQAIIAQECIDNIEIIVLDSSSTDNSVAISLKYGAKIISILPNEFNHGLTRNKGVNHASGELVFLTVQDAWLSDNIHFQKMISHFTDHEVQSVNGMQAIPHDIKKNPALWFKRSCTPLTETHQYKDGKFFKDIAPSQQKAICCWDNVNTMYRKSALINLPFEKTNLSEDMIWSKKALEIGWKIIRDPSLVAYHYHHHTFIYNFKVNYAVAYIDRITFGIKPKYPLIIMPFLRRVYSITKNKKLKGLSKLSWIIHNAGIFISHLLSVYVFRALLFLGGANLLNRSLHLFCNNALQGKQK